MDRQGVTSGSSPGRSESPGNPGARPEPCLSEGWTPPAEQGESPNLFTPGLLAARGPAVGRADSNQSPVPADRRVAAEPLAVVASSSRAPHHGMEMHRSFPNPSKKTSASAAHPDLQRRGTTRDASVPCPNGDQTHQNRSTKACEEHDQAGTYRFVAEQFS